VLVREFGADANAGDELDMTPLHWAHSAAPGHRVAAVNALVALLAPTSNGAGRAQAGALCSGP
jgi:hypothetical protein